MIDKGRFQQSVSTYMKDTPMSLLCIKLNIATALVQFPSDIQCRNGHNTRTDNIAVDNSKLIYTFTSDDRKRYLPLIVIGKCR